MNNAQSLLLQVIGAALFGGETPAVDEKVICPLLNESKKITSEHLDSLMNDILRGGNFGKKDMNRYREIKYISDRGEHTVRSGGIVKQGFKSLNSRVYSDYETISKHHALLPLGYIAEGGRYLGLLITGKRKSSGTKQMLQEAAERKKIYKSLHLFE